MYTDVLRPEPASHPASSGPTLLVAEHWAEPPAVQCFPNFAVGLHTVEKVYMSVPLFQFTPILSFLALCV